MCKKEGADLDTRTVWLHVRCLGDLTDVGMPREQSQNPFGYLSAMLSGQLCPGLSIQ